MVPVKPNDHITTVSDLTWRIKDVLEQSFSDISVTGEVSQPTTSTNGHIYFTLKDEGASIACVIWRSAVQKQGIRLSHGQQVNVTGDVQVYPPSGRYQIIVKSVEQAGAGALQLAFERLKKKLDNEGLFSAEHKKSLPKLPKRIGVVTSETGAAFQDIRSTLEKRYPLATVVLYHTAVQGSSAASAIADGIRYFSESGDVDVLIIGRGGGSLEDLWPFNEEVVARAIHHCRVPVISAVGHETDFSISDFVADVRAATPTQAAMLVAPDINELKIWVEDRLVKISATVLGLIELRKTKIETLVRSHVLRVITDKVRFSKETIRNCKVQLNQIVRSRLIHLRDKNLTNRRSLEPTVRLRIIRDKSIADTFANQIKASVNRKLQASHGAWMESNYSLKSNNPLEPLEKGFTRVTQHGKWVKRVKDVEHEQPLVIQWNDGQLER